MIRQQYIVRMSAPNRICPEYLMMNQIYLFIINLNVIDPHD